MFFTKRLTSSSNEKHFFSVCFFSKRAVCRDEHHYIIQLKETIFHSCHGFQPQQSSFFLVAMRVWSLEPCGYVWVVILPLLLGEEIRYSHFWEGAGHGFQKKSVKGSLKVHSTFCSLSHGCDMPVQAWWAISVFFSLLFCIILLLISMLLQFDFLSHCYQ